MSGRLVATPGRGFPDRQHYRVLVVAQNGDPGDDIPSLVAGLVMDGFATPVCPLRARKTLNVTPRLMRIVAAAQRSPGTSELGQLGERRHDPYLTRTEFDDQRSIVLDTDDPA